MVDDKEYKCKARGVFKNQNITPLAGDIVDITDDLVINNIHKRKNELIRPSISNVDQAFIITCVKAPKFLTDLLDKLLVVLEFNNIKPIICFTKLDLLNKEELDVINKYINYYKQLYDVYNNQEIDEVKNCFKDKVTVLTGQSGAGKSTLLNKLDDKLNIKTGAISLKLDRGKNTTTCVSLLSLCDGLIADTPGFTALSLNTLSKTAIRDNFKEFNLYKENCEYRDCMHDKETNCEIKRRVETGEILTTRYYNYLNFIKN